MNITEYSTLAELDTAVSSNFHLPGEMLRVTLDSEIYVVVDSAIPYKYAYITLNKFERLRSKSLVQVTANHDSLAQLLSKFSLSFGDGNLTLTVGGLMDMSNIQYGSTAYGLSLPNGVMCDTNQPDLGVPYDTVKPTGYSYNEEDGETINIKGQTNFQPGATSGTRVSCLNPDPNQVPRQDIIDSLHKMATELNIYVQITFHGGWTTRGSGTQNHPTGWAADFQVVEGTGIIRPINNPDLYKSIIKTLVSNAKAKGIRPGIGGYGGFIHYDESPWRQDQKNSKDPLTALCGHWNSGFYITDTLEELL